MAGDDAEPVDELVRAAATLELVHQATLVHDDVLDDAMIRHNVPTLNEAYNAHTAVLLGDVMFSHALKLASDFPTVNVCRAVSKATRQVCSGEIAQTFQHRKPEVTIEDYYRVIDLKTAELFRVACELGAELAGYNESFVNAASVFGTQLGIAYQIFDDMADIHGDEATIGKTLGTDIIGGKFTLPMLFLLDEVDSDLKEALIQSIKNQTADVDQWAQLIAKHGIVEKVEEAFLEAIQKVERALAPFEAFPAYAPLKAISEYVQAQAKRLHA